MPDTKPPVVNDVSAPTIDKHNASMTTNSDAAPTAEPADVIKKVSNIGANIAPPEASSQPSDTPIEESKITEPVENTNKDAEKQVAEEKEQKTGPASPYEAVDSLPDMSEKKTTELTNTMDAPRIYDTKEYVVPIKDTMHSHGTVGKIVAGVVSAIVVVGGIVAVAYFLV